MDTPIFSLTKNPPLIKPEQCGRLAILAGGHSPERAVSLVSGQAVLKACQGLGLSAEIVDPANGLAALWEGQFDRVFIALHGAFGEDGRIQAFLDVLGLPYTGAGSLACALSMDKIKTKALWMHQALPTLPYCAPQSLEQLRQWALLQGYPLTVKPSNGGSSLGITHVRDDIDLESAYQKALRYGPVMAEPMVENARELTVGIVNNQVLPPVEIQPKAAFYDYDAKYTREDTTYLAPAPLTRQQTNQIQQLAWQAFQAIGAHAWGRVDFLANQQGDLFLLEINTVPGLSAQHALIRKAAQAAGLSFSDLINVILVASVNVTQDEPVLVD